jgi:glycosyltransferase involved in cell wall biosynthesis
MGKAVLVSRLKAIRHHFGEDALAYFDPDNPSDLAQQMVRIFDDSQLRFRLARKASNAYAPIRWDLMKQRYLDLMDNVIGAPERLAVEESPSDPPTVVA